MSTWVFLRGLTRESRHWGRFPESFRAAIPDASIHMPDLPGNGARHGESSPLTVEEMAEDCRARLRRQGVPPPYHLLAMSLGGMVGIAWAARHPEDIGGCVLINTSVRSVSPFHRRLRPGCYLPLLMALGLQHSARARESAILRITSRRVEPTHGLIDEWISYRNEHPVSTRNALRQLLAAVRYRAPAAHPVAPFLILASQGDALVHPKCSRQLAMRWNAACAEHPTAGHDLPLDDGPWVARQVGEWLRSLP